jgi:ceramide glucosyltransferase
MLAVGLFGVLASTVFLALVALAARKHRRFAARAHAEVDSLAISSLPPVSMLKPVHGLEPRMEENLESFFLQDYPDFEIVFAARNASDPAFTVVERLCRRHPHVRVRIVLSGEPTWPNAKVFSLDKMIAACTRDYFVITDSDILVAPDFLRNVITPLLEPQNGLVTCLYRGVAASDFWSGMEALGMSVEMPSGVLVANLMEGMQFALGAVMAVRRDALEAIGGIRSTCDYYSDDFVLGQLVASSGYSVVLSHHKVGHVLQGTSFLKSFRDQLRWATSTRYSRPSGHVGEGLTYSVFFGMLALAGGILAGHVAIGVGAFAWTLLSRMAQAYGIGWGIVGDRRARRSFWLYPLRDFLGFFVWAGSFLGDSAFVWRGETYRFTPGGRIVPEGRAFKVGSAK